MASDDCPNALFLSWVKEYWDQAKERNTKGVLAYKHAYDSLRACPIRYEHPEQLLVLKGFGPKTCSRLTERLAQHCSDNGLPMPKKRRARRSEASRTGSAIEAEPTVGTVVASGTPTARRSTRKPKSYVPALRQGGYGILMALSSPEAETLVWVAKAEVIELAQPHCDTSYTVKPPGKFYTAWESIKTLLKHDLVVEQGRPSKRYMLTEDGWETANKLREVVGEPLAKAHQTGRGREESAETANQQAGSLAETDLVPEGDVFSDDDTIPHVTPVVLPPGSFSVQLLLDTRERVTGQRTYMEDELAKHGVKPLVRPLSVGDSLWVAKCHGHVDGIDSDEIVLDWIVERKRQDDLIGSIKDGRFREQKFRQRRSGARHVVYIIENSNLDVDILHKYEEAMNSAIASTQVVNGYFVKRTRSVDDTIAYLARMTKILEKRYAGKSLKVIPTTSLTAKNYLPLLNELRANEQPNTTVEYGITYPAFASLTSKSESLTLRDIFLKMLMCTRGVTGERALEIQKKWKTPHDFVQAYGQLGSNDSAESRKRKRLMVSDELGNLIGAKRRVTKPISEKLAEAWADAQE